MSLSIVKDSIDLGIVTKNADKMLVFYRDLLGLEVEGQLPMPDGGVMHRLKCGGSIIKIVVNHEEPPAVSPSGGISGATGCRYWTITIDNLEQAVKTCSDAVR